jgi:RHS repeat-associated protein
MSWVSRFLGVVAVVAAFMWSGSSFAQNASDFMSNVPGPLAVDEHGVDLLSGQLQLPTQPLSIGSPSSGISRLGTRLPGYYKDNFTVDLSMIQGVNPTPHTLLVTIDGRLYYYNEVDTYNYALDFVSTEKNAGKVHCDSPFGSRVGYCTLTTYEGVQYKFDMSFRVLSGYPDNAHVSMINGSAAPEAVLSTVSKPDGEIINFNYSITVVNNDQVGYKFYSLQSITSNLGWMIKYKVPSYTVWSGAYGDFIIAPAPATEAEAINTAKDYCNPFAVECDSLQHNWNKLDLKSEFTDYSTTTSAILTDFVGNQTTISDNGRTIISPSGLVETVTYWPYPNEEDPNYVKQAFKAGKVSSVTDRGITYTYDYEPLDTWTPEWPWGGGTTRVTGPTGTKEYYVLDGIQITYVKDELGRKTSYEYLGTGSPPSRVIGPDATYSGSTVTGGYTEYSYDNQLRLTTITVVPKAGSGLPNLVTHATYETCNDNNIKYCHKPVTITDAAGVTTTYTYKAENGEVETVTKPAINGIAPQVRYVYAPLTPHIKDSSGTLVETSPVWRLVSTSSCRTQASCAGTTDEVKTTYTYEPNNLLPETTTVSLGDGTLAQTTAVHYDIYGRVDWSDGPKPGDVDRTYYFYDAMDRVVGTISPDPDGGGSRPRLATRTTYDSEGRVAAVETGTTYGTTLGDLNSLSPVAKSTTEFNATTGLPQVARSYVFENGAYALKNVGQTTYDTALRVDCVAQRLNPDIFGSLPSSACTPGTAGPDGNDRITKYTYDVTNAVTQVTAAYGTGNAKTETKTINAASGRLDAVTDGNGNTTTFEYDAFGRPTKTHYPNPARSDDYAETVYSGARAFSVRLRDGLTVAFGYDDLGRISGTSGAINQSFGYDNFSHIVSHAQNGTTEGYTYNALGWLLSDTQPLATVNYDYDGYGRRTKLTYPSSPTGGFFVTYSYNDADELTGIYENGNSALATFDYDNLGRASHLYRGNGQTTTYAFNSAQEFSSLSQLGNTSSFLYRKTGQLKSVDISLPAFQPPPPNLTVTAASPVNALNQLTSIGGEGLSYDNRGNLSGATNANFTYDANNLLIQAVQSGVTSSLTYDASNRLFSISKNGVATKFLYDGSDLIAEYDGSGNLLRRYVHGGGTDQPLVWYEGSGTATKYYLHADERGSVVATSDASGATVNINRYDTYGLETSSAPAYASRFAYTGQTWLPEIGMYYYKARLYNPVIGRFMQTDPLDYGDGLNWYAYVGNDPVNNTDPSGTQCKAVTVYNWLPTQQDSGQENMIQVAATHWTCDDDELSNYETFRLKDFPVSGGPSNNLDGGQIELIGGGGIPSPPGKIPGGPWTPTSGRPGEFKGVKPPKGPPPRLQYVPKNTVKNSKNNPYWKKSNGVDKGWQNRYDVNGNEITPDQAHPGPVPFNFLDWPYWGGPMTLPTPFIPPVYEPSLHPYHCEPDKQCVA